MITLDSLVIKWILPDNSYAFPWTFRQGDRAFILRQKRQQGNTRDQLLDQVWGFEYFGDTRTVDVHIKRLREKLEGVSDKWSLKTVWGVGYKFELSKS